MTSTPPLAACFILAVVPKLMLVRKSKVSVVSRTLGERRGSVDPSLGCKRELHTLRAKRQLRFFPPGAPLRRGGVKKENVGPHSAALRPHIL